jgi:small subunit ribosomal protein S18
LSLSAALADHPASEEEFMPRTARKDPVRKRKKPMLDPDVRYVDYKDVHVLRAFISDRGKIRSRRVTGLTVQQQRMVATAVKNAREMALLPYESRAR